VLGTLVAVLAGAGTVLALGAAIWYFFRKAATAESNASTMEAGVAEGKERVDSLESAAIAVEIQERKQEASVKQDVIDRVDVERARSMLRDAFNKGGSN
jgi:hypothetical protein